MRRWLKQNRNDALEQVLFVAGAEVCCHGQTQSGSVVSERFVALLIM